MRAPKRHRPQLRKFGVAAGADLVQVAGRVRYIGSSEHKDAPSFAGQPKARADASICDRGITQQQAQEWLEKAIRIGSTSEYWEGDFPRYVWFKVGGVAYEARLVNSGNGEYKGWPLSEAEWPADLSNVYG